MTDEGDATEPSARATTLRRASVPSSAGFVIVLALLAMAGISILAIAMLGGPRVTADGDSGASRAATASSFVDTRGLQLKAYLSDNSSLQVLKSEAGDLRRIHDDRTILSVRGLEPGLAAMLSRWQGVDQSTAVQSDVAGLMAVRDPAGAVLFDLADGFQIPMSTVIIDPTSYASLVHSDDAEASAALANLRPGTVLLSTSGARLRQVDSGAILTFTSPDGPVALEVAGVVSDDWARGAEMVAHSSDAESLGFQDRRQSLVVLHHGGEQMTDRLIAVLASVTGRTPHVSVLYPADDEPPIRLVLSLAQVKERFGEFSYRPRPGVREIIVDPAFADEHMVTTTVPILGEVRCHRLILDDLVGALNDIIAADLDSWIDPRTYAGCHYPRRISTERARLSNHSWGIAVDFNVDLSMPGLGPVPPTEMIEIFGRHGFRWGGDFSQPDNHHWEWVGAHATQRPHR